MHIRIATIDDCEQISKLHCSSYKKAGEGKLPNDYLNKLTQEVFLSRWQSRFKEKTILTIVAEIESNIVGFATVNNFNCVDDVKKEKLEFKFFYIHIDYWRKKIGTQIALYVANTLIKNGYNSISGFALKEDLQSNGFYSYLGAQVISTQKIWLPLGSTPETYPNGTYADANNYVVEDVKKAVTSFIQRSQTFSLKVTPPIFGLFSSNNNQSSGVHIEHVKNLSNF